MIVDKLRFIPSKICVYDENHTFYFGSLDGSVKEKWYFIDENNECFDLKSSKVKNTETFRICKNGQQKHFYKPKMALKQTIFSKPMNVNYLNKNL